MSSRAEDFPTPVSPTRRMVYDAFVNVARNSVSINAPKITLQLLDSGDVNLIIAFQGVLAWASKMMPGSDLVTARIGQGQQLSTATAKERLTASALFVRQSTWPHQMMEWYKRHHR